MSEEPEYVNEFDGLILEDQLLDHLATPEGATAIWRERLVPEVIDDSDEGIREALKFVISYMDEYRQPPSLAVLMEETGYSDFQEPQAPVAYVLGKLRERYQRQELKRTVTKLARLSAEPDNAISLGLSEFSRIRQDTTSRQDTVTSDDVGLTLDEYRLRKQSGFTGLTFGYEEIDAHLGGLKLNELTVVLARPKRYKSWQLLKSACDAVLGDGEDPDTGHTVYFDTMELHQTEMLNRFSCMASGVSWYKYSKGLLSPQEERQFDETAFWLQEWPNKLVFHRPKSGDRNVRNIVSQATDAGAAALYIDQLSWFDDAKSEEKSWLKIGKIMEELKVAATNFPVYMAAQFNREAQGMTGLPDLAHIALADAVGQTADNLLGIYASRDMLENHIIHFGVVDSRSHEQKIWEIGVRLTERANFTFLSTIESGEDGD